MHTNPLPPHHSPSLPIPLAVYGSAIGTLRVMGDDDTTYWTRSTCNPCTSSGNWATASVPLGLTDGSGFRFEYIRGTSYTSDGAVAMVTVTCGIQPPQPPALPPYSPPPSLPLGCPVDTCLYKHDGSCDDGGDGAEYSDCALGTDCYDCGPRLSPPPSFPPVPPLDADKAYPLVVPLLETKFTVMMPKAEWNTLYSDAAFRTTFIAGIRQLFNCWGSPRCEATVLGSGEAVAVDWQTACNRTLPPPPSSPPMPPNPPMPPPPISPKDSTPTNTTNSTNATAADDAGAGFFQGTICDRNGTLVTVQMTWEESEVVKLCPPSAPTPPPEPPYPPPPPPPPSPWYDKVNDGNNPKTMEDTLVRAQLRLMRMSPPSPPPPPPPGCQTAEQLIDGSLNATYHAKHVVSQRSIASIEQEIGLPLFSLISVHMGATDDMTTRGITMPPSTPPPPPIPSVPPPPPSPPAPPAPPPALCTDTCNDSGLGVPGTCDDGGDGSVGIPPCEVGTDCVDCGLRSFCFSCPQECHDEAVKQDTADASCLEHMWNQDGCYSQCNTAACGHHHCTTESAIVECLRTEEANGGDFMTMPANALGVTEVSILPFKLGQIKLVVDGAKSNVVQADFTVDYTLSWVDERVPTSACRAVFNEMLSSKGAEESTHIGRYWRPRLDIATDESNAEIRELIRSDFKYTEGNTTVYLERQERFVLSQSFDYSFFPFDRQTIVFDISVPLVSVKGCESLRDMLHENEIESPPDPKTFLLPSTAAWLWRTCGSAHGDCTTETISKDIEMTLPNKAHKDICKLRLYVRRDNILEIAKNIGPLVVIGYVPMLALWLNPMIPPLVGGRVSAHILTMVLVMVKVSNKTTSRAPHSLLLPHHTPRTYALPYPLTVQCQPRSRRAHLDDLDRRILPLALRHRRDGPLRDDPHPLAPPLRQGRPCGLDRRGLPQADADVRLPVHYDLGIPGGQQSIHHRHRRVCRRH